MEPEVGPRATGGVLSREQIGELIRAESHPLVTGYRDLDAQLQPNGIDLTLRDISRHAGMGTIGVDSATRMLPPVAPLAFGDDGWLTLDPGTYHITYNEIVDIPDSLMALGRPRSSLGRCGVTIHTSVWDAGYNGRSTSLLVVQNPAGFRVQQNARVMQLVFFSMSAMPAEGYRGTYQGENI